MVGIQEVSSSNLIICEIKVKNAHKTTHVRGLEVEDAVEIDPKAGNQSTYKNRMKQHTNAPNVASKCHNTRFL